MALTSARRFPVEEIGVFLCDYPLREPFEFVDMPNEREIRQDATLRALVALRKLNLLASDDPVTAFNAQPGIVALSYRWARTDAVRAYLGRGKRQRAIELRKGAEFLADPNRKICLSRLMPIPLLRFADTRSLACRVLPWNKQAACSP